MYMDPKPNYVAGESYLKFRIRKEMEAERARISKERFDATKRPHLPRTSILARMKSLDRKAVLAHFYAREFALVACFANEGFKASESAARKRLAHVERVTLLFEEIEREADRRNAERAGTRVKFLQ